MRSEIVIARAVHVAPLAGRSGRTLLHAGFLGGFSTVKLRAGAFDYAAVVACPICKFCYGLEERLAQGGESVLDPGRHGREDCSQHKTVSFQSAQRVREHSLRDALNDSLELIEALRAVPEQHDQKNAPLIPYPGQHFTSEGACSIVRENVGSLGVTS